MPEYQYQGVSQTGQRVQGKLDVPTEGELRMLLRAQGIRPTRISKVSALNVDIGSVLSRGVISVSIENLVSFTRLLQLLIGSGIPLVQSLDILTEQVPNAVFKNVILVIREKVSQGSYFWEAISAYPSVFPKLYIALIRAGEASGSMDAMLKRTAKYLEDSDRLKKLIKSTMMYPIVVTCIGVAVVAIMMIFVIPKFESMLSNAGQELPGPTLFVIGLSHFLINNIVALIIGLVLFIYVFFRYLSSEEGRAVKDRVLFRLPLFGTVMQKSGVAKFSRTMQTLLASGVNLVDAIEICKETIDNTVLEDAVSKIRVEIEAGKTLGSVIAKLGVFPSMAVQMINVGESTGNLDKMLEKVADFFEEDVQTLIGGMTKLIEPLVLVVLGGTVGGIMIAMYLPIFKLAGGV